MKCGLICARSAHLELGEAPRATRRAPRARPAPRPSPRPRPWRAQPRAARREGHDRPDGLAARADRRGRGIRLARRRRDAGDRPAPRPRRAGQPSARRRDERLVAVDRDRPPDITSARCRRRALPAGARRAAGSASVMSPRRCSRRRDARCSVWYVACSASVPSSRDCTTRRRSSTTTPTASAPATTPAAATSSIDSGMHVTVAVVRRDARRSSHHPRRSATTTVGPRRDIRFVSIGELRPQRRGAGPRDPSKERRHGQ